jgi:hypothetical protein
MSEAESSALQSFTRDEHEPISVVATAKIDSTHTGHVRHVDDPVTNAQASLLYSVAYIIVVFIAILALLIITDIADGDGAAFFGILIGGTSFFALGILSLNRRQGLHHSATGIAHHELKSRERISDRQAQTVEHQIDADLEARLASITARKELGLEFLKRLEGKHDA